MGLKKGKVNYIVTVQVLVISFIQLVICVRWYPSFYKTDSLACQKPRGQFSHPKYCDQFLNCWDNSAVVGHCTGGLVFNEKISACDYPRNVDCTGKENSHASPVDSRCSQPFGTFPNPYNCSEYIVCHAGLANIIACPEKTYYNPALRVCTYEKDPNCIDGGHGEQPTIPPRPEETSTIPTTVASTLPSSTPTLESSSTSKPTYKPQHPIKPKPPLEPVSIIEQTSVPTTTTEQQESTTTKAPYPLKPKPPLEPESINQNPQTSLPPITPESQEPQSTSSTPKPTVNLKPKPGLKPEGSAPGERPPISEIVEGVHPEQPPTATIPPLNPGSLRPPSPPGPPNIGPSTTPEPIDGEDDPHILFPFLPPFPELFRCPVPNAILPIVGVCESVIICLEGVAHNFRCQEGHTFDIEKRRCNVLRNSCKSKEKNNLRLSKPAPHVLYAYLPLSRIKNVLVSNAIL